MSADWQQWSALAIVVATVVIASLRFIRSRKSGCGGGCGCAKDALKKR